MNNRLTSNGRRTFCGPDLVPPRGWPRSKQVAARYAVSISPTMAELIDPSRSG